MLFLFIYSSISGSQINISSTVFIYSTDRLAKQTVRLATSPLVPWLFPLSFYMRLLPCPSRGLPLDERQSAAELEAVLQHHHSLQEKLAEDMLHLARNLKNNTLAAHSIIKQDNQVTHVRRPSPATKKIISAVVFLQLRLICSVLVPPSESARFCLDFRALPRGECPQGAVLTPPSSVLHRLWASRCGRRT